jgi:hypothetical protein
MQKLAFFVMLLIPVLAFSQRSGIDTSFIFWSKNRPLQESDFKINVEHFCSSHSFARYSWDYDVKANFAFGLPKDYKKRIRNYFIKNAAWLDTTYDVDVSIKYQQTLFNLAEIYVRKFRQDVYLNRKKVARGKISINELNAEESRKFTNRRIQYDIETNFASVPDTQQQWEKQIQKELDDLKDFAAD